MLVEEVVELLRKSSGLSDRELTDQLRGTNHPSQQINGICRRLAKKSMVARRTRLDGIIGNYLADQDNPSPPDQIPEPEDRQSLNQSEDQIKQTLQRYLSYESWTIIGIAWGKTRGVDIEAERGGERWLIEVKGIGSRPQMRVNYFLGVLGELLCRMADPGAKYSIAVPDVTQFRSLWRRHPDEAKSRTRITALFVGEASVIEEA